MPVEVQLTNRIWTTKVSQEDYEWVRQHRWFAKQSNGNWYVCTSMRIGPKVHTIRLHRQVMDCPDDMTVDHLDNDPFNNVRENLEIVTLEENVRRRWRRNAGLPIYETDDEIPF